MRWKIPALLSIGLLLGVVLATLLNRVGARAQHPEPDTLILQVQKLKQLVTVRVSLQRIVQMTEDKVPLGSESILLMVQGEAIAGVDLGQLTSHNVTVGAGGKVLVDLPRAQLLSTYLDEKQIRIWDRHVTWWTPWVPFSPDLEHRARLRAIDDIRNAALGWASCNSRKPMRKRQSEICLARSMCRSSLAKRACRGSRRGPGILNVSKECIERAASIGGLKWMQQRKVLR